MIFNLSKKRNLFPLFFILIVFSCSNLTYKSKVSDKVEILLLDLKNGKLDSLPGFTEKNLDSEIVNTLKVYFSTMEFWTINIDDIDPNGIVTANIDVSINDVKTNLVFQYKLEKGEWTLQQEMNVTKSMTIVSNDIKKEAE